MGFVLEIDLTLKEKPNVGYKHTYFKERQITRAESKELPTPPATATHVPIPHAAVVDTLIQTLSHRHIVMVGEEFAVSRDGDVQHPQSCLSRRLHTGLSKAFE